MEKKVGCLQWWNYGVKGGVEMDRMDGHCGEEGRRLDGCTEFVEKTGGVDGFRKMQLLKKEGETCG